MPGAKSQPLIKYEKNIYPSHGTCLGKVENTDASMLADSQSAIDLVSDSEVNQSSEASVLEEERLTNSESDIQQTSALSVQASNMLNNVEDEKVEKVSIPKKIPIIRNDLSAEENNKEESDIDSSGASDSNDDSYLTTTEFSESAKSGKKSQEILKAEFEKQEALNKEIKISSGKADNLSWAESLQNSIASIQNIFRNDSTFKRLADGDTDKNIKRGLAKPKDEMNIDITTKAVISPSTTSHMLPETRHYVKTNLGSGDVIVTGKIKFLKKKKHHKKLKHRKPLAMKSQLSTITEVASTTEDSESDATFTETTALTTSNTTQGLTSPDDGSTAISSIGDMPSRGMGDAPSSSFVNNTTESNKSSSSAFDISAEILCSTGLSSSDPSDKTNTNESFTEPETRDGSSNNNNASSGAEVSGSATVDEEFSNTTTSDSFGETPNVSTEVKTSSNSIETSQSDTVSSSSSNTNQTPESGATASHSTATTSTDDESAIESTVDSETSYFATSSDSTSVDSSSYDSEDTTISTGFTDDLQTSDLTVLSDSTDITTSDTTTTDDSIITQLRVCEKVINV